MTAEKATPPGIALDNEALARAATPGPWPWWSSNSTLRLTGADGRDGGVLYGYVHAEGGDVYWSDTNQALIDAANPATFTALAARARAAQPQPSAAPDEWMPIEAAPMGAKGYAWMMLKWGNPEDPNTGAGMRCGDRFFASATFYCLGQAKQYEFREIEVNPTHWMPMQDTSKDNKTTSPNFAARGAEPDFDSLTTYPSPHGTLVRLADVKCRVWSAARGAEPAGMQAAERSLTPTDEQIEAAFKAAGGRWQDESYWVIEDADLHPFVRAQLSAAGQGQEVERNAALEETAKMLLNGYFLHDKAPRKLFANEAAKAIREMKRAATQPTAAPTPQAQPAGASRVPVLEGWAKAGERITIVDFRGMLSNVICAGSEAYRKEASDLILSTIANEINLARQGAAPTPHEQEARAAWVGSLPENYTVDDSELARRIMVFLGRATTASMEPGADPLRDRLAEKLAEWTKTPAAQAGMLPVVQTDAARDVTDTQRLDWLDGVNRKTNAHYGTQYGWKFDINHNRAALMDHNWPAHTVRQAIDAAMIERSAKDAAGLEGGDA